MSMLNDCLPSSYLWINAAEGADRMVYLKKGGGIYGEERFNIKLYTFKN